ncbi:hypothetical protein AOC05_06885 [Arthrobacter alpinus]|uniref:Putative zinc-finger domain-containing protein n=1 Tax=Arthrobacter alpinus TaxID=656366 RepID=A0A0M5LX97_9MICC|nr:zf-HC2 domain-containing protein [Arthrobacter alpinus]ALE92120.1 hypothetical protein AOC05_06885 [Arthrobacter alpinus]
MSKGNPDEFATWDAAYILGALPPTERRAYEDHLAGCAACRARVAGLSPLPGLLAVAGAEQDPAEVQTVPAYRVFGRKVRRRRARWALAAAAAVLITGAGTLGLTAALDGSFPGAGVPTAADPATSQTSHGPGIAVRFTSTGQTALQATGALAPRPWGTQISWTCSYAATGYQGDTTYELVLRSTDGKSTVVGSWQASPGETVTPVATTTVAVDDIAALEVRRAGTVQALLRAAP